MGIQTDNTEYHVNIPNQSPLSEKRPVYPLEVKLSVFASLLFLDISEDPLRRDSTKTSKLCGLHGTKFFLFSLLGSEILHGVLTKK